MATYKAPTEAQVNEALRKIPSMQLRRAFFEGLKNPLWVKPLAKQGAFRNPPEPERMSDGLIRDVYWPEIGYLVRVAPEVPAAVVDVLLKLDKSNNAWVRRGVFTIGATIQAKQAARLRPLIKTWTSTGFGWRTDPRDVVGLAVNLLQGGQYQIGKWLANFLFTPAKPSSGQAHGTVLDEYWYEEGLPKIVAVLGNDGLSVVLPWLVAYERSDGRFKPGSDLTAMSRESIRSRSESYTSIEQTLIDSVRDLAIKAMLQDAREATAALLKSKMILVRKIALFALNEAIEQSTDNDEYMQPMLQVAAELLFDVDSLNDFCRIEYAELTRSVAARAGDKLEFLPEFIETGLVVDDDARLRQWFEGDGADDDVVDRQIRDYRDRRMHRWLSAIGMEALPERLRTKLADLDGRFGVIESPLAAENRIAMWTGPNSPISLDDMSVMSAAELVAHLESWHYTGNGWGPDPSHEGQGRQLTALLTTNPKTLSGVDDLVERLRPIYIRAILHGWEAAIKADLELDWDQTAEVTRGVLAHAEESTFPTEGDEFHDDADYRLAKQAAVGLLESLVRKRTGHDIPDAIMTELADLLVTLAEDERAWSRYISYDKESGMDPLTVSLNWQWPIRLRGLISLMYHGQGSSWYVPARSALERELGRDDTRGASRAVLGEGLGRLLEVDPEWLQENIPVWFGDEEGLTSGQQVALTTAIAVHHYHPRLYELLAPSMIAAVKLQAPIVVGWRGPSDPLQRIGEWTIEAIIRGHQTLEDPEARVFFTVAPAKLRGDAIGHIAWAFMNAETVDQVIRDRFAALWDARADHVRSNPDDREELSGFYWFVKSGKFDVEWWLPRLKKAAELDPQLIANSYMIGKEIASAADVDPRGSFDSLKLALEGSDDVGMAASDLSRNAVPMVLARAIASGDSGLKREAESYMNYLGEQGYLHLETEVNQILSRIVTQRDISD